MAENKTGDKKLDAIGITIEDLNSPKIEIVQEEIIDLVFQYPLSELKTYDDLLKIEENLQDDEPHKQLYLSLLKHYRPFGEIYLDAAKRVYDYIKGDDHDLLAEYKEVTRK